MLGGADIEVTPGQLVDLGLDHGHALREFGGHGAQVIGIDRNARALHIRQDRYQRALHFLIQRQRVVGAQLRPEHLPQPQGHIRVLRRVRRGARDIHLGKHHPVAARARHLVIGDGCVVKCQA